MFIVISITPQAKINPCTKFILEYQHQLEHEAILKNKKRSGTSLPGLFSA